MQRQPIPDAQRIERLPPKHRGTRRDRLPKSRGGRGSRCPLKPPAADRTTPPRQATGRKRGHKQLRRTLDAAPHATGYHQMREHKYRHRPQNRAQRRCREVGEVTRNVCRIAPHLPRRRSEDVLQAPSRHHSIVAGDEESCENAHVPHYFQAVPPAICEYARAVLAARSGLL